MVLKDSPGKLVDFCCSSEYCFSDKSYKSFKWNWYPKKTRSLANLNHVYFSRPKSLHRFRSTALHRICLFPLHHNSLFLRWKARAYFNNLLPKRSTHSLLTYQLYMLDSNNDSCYPLLVKYVFNFPDLPLKVVLFAKAKFSVTQTELGSFLLLIW
jgi:hypothetical protein